MRNPGIQVMKQKQKNSEKCAIQVCTLWNKNKSTTKNLPSRYTCYETKTKEQRKMHNPGIHAMKQKQKNSEKCAIQVCMLWNKNKRTSKNAQSRYTCYETKTKTQRKMRRYTCCETKTKEQWKMRNPGIAAMKQKQKHELYMVWNKRQKHSEKCAGIAAMTPDSNLSNWKKCAKHATKMRIIFLIEKNAQSNWIKCAKYAQSRCTCYETNKKAQRGIAAMTPDSNLSNWTRYQLCSNKARRPPSLKGTQ